MKIRRLLYMGFICIAGIFMSCNSGLREVEHPKYGLVKLTKEDLIAEVYFSEYDCYVKIDEDQQFYMTYGYFPFEFVFFDRKERQLSMRFLSDSTFLIANKYSNLEVEEIYKYENIGGTNPVLIVKGLMSTTRDKNVQKNTVLPYQRVEIKSVEQLFPNIEGDTIHIVANGSNLYCREYWFRRK